jgi:hypothetical protein
MTAEWKHIRPVLLKMSGLPEWAREIISVDTHVMPAGVTLEEESIDTSYIEFLEEQIKLAPRGEEWNQVLKERKRALEGQVGETMVRVAIRNRRDGFVARLALPTLDVIHGEKL